MFILTPNIITPQHLLLVAALMLYTGIEHLSLMTYGWAILIIAVVLGALFQLGVFNTNNFAPRAQPGACQVIRPYGPGTIEDISLQGLCNGQLPEYVGTFAGSSISATVPASTFFTSNNPPFTVSGWFETSTPQTGIGTFFQDLGGGGGCTNGFIVGDYLSTNSVGFSIVCTDYRSSLVIDDGHWHFFALTYAATGNALIYVDGTNTPETSVPSLSLVNSGAIATIGGAGIDGGYFTGGLSNIQLYNASLSAGEVQALYTEGIGGAPVRPQNLVGWWPLNGNANDYSGDLNNGAATNVVYSSAWSSQYTGPV